MTTDGDTPQFPKDEDEVKKLGNEIHNTTCTINKQCWDRIKWAQSLTTSGIDGDDRTKASSKWVCTTTGPSCKQNNKVCLCYVVFTNAIYYRAAISIELVETERAVDEAAQAVDVWGPVYAGPT